MFAPKPEDETLHEEAMDDPIVAEVRRARQELFAQYDNDLEKFFAGMRERQKAHPERVVDLSTPEGRAKYEAQQAAKQNNSL